MRTEGTTHTCHYIGLDYLTYWRVGNSAQCLRRSPAAATVVMSPVAARIPAAAMVVMNPVAATIPAATMLGQSAAPAIPAAPG